MLRTWITIQKDMVIFNRTSLGLELVSLKNITVSSLHTMMFSLFQKSSTVEWCTRWKMHWSIAKWVPFRLYISDSRGRWHTKIFETMKFLMVKETCNYSVTNIANFFWNITSTENWRNYSQDWVFLAAQAYLCDADWDDATEKNKQFVHRKWIWSQCEHELHRTKLNYKRINCIYNTWSTFAIKSLHINDLYSDPLR